MVIEDLRDEARTAVAEKQSAYVASFALGSSLLHAIDAREKFLADLADAKAKRPDVWDKRTKRYHSNNRPFFETLIHRRWTEEVGRQRHSINVRYSHLREAERAR